ncbi:DUF3077 domain-containing protein [Pseudomonas panipatensis]|uniref:DUF3077 domain-containing protein n=1 Tax=Pseudomonas panipatensis TaxID=428992 RepID=A0A1G8LIH1_9PSED|nr:DUF3077 domain-containing protein [Pseudomonas panipatensis]SDI55481.1 Protein of unknown function [Pseudomonas panipatensis]SMP74827.1 Protein of unknown function [Pseudomonas panipatensis]
MKALTSTLTATTETTPFGTLGCIRAGLPVLEVLEQTASLLECAEATGREAASLDAEQGRHLAWASLALLEQARAALNAAVAGLYRQRRESA